jgi:hypothetical protein
VNEGKKGVRIGVEVVYDLEEEEKDLLRKILICTGFPATPPISDFLLRSVEEMGGTISLCMRCFQVFGMMPLICCEIQINKSFSRQPVKIGTFNPLPNFTNNHPHFASVSNPKKKRS